MRARARHWRLRAWLLQREYPLRGEDVFLNAPGTFAIERGT